MVALIRHRVKMWRMDAPLWIWPALALAIGYLLGSIPFGLVLTRLFGAGDLRAIGSGSIGATNVLRTGRKDLAAATTLLDIAKGTVAVLIAGQLGTGFALLGGVGAFLGHCYPIWLRFNGGKGVATMMGISVALGWQIGLGFAIVWLTVLAATRISSVGGIAAAISAPIIAFWMDESAIGVMLLALALLVLWKHRANIGRLRAGTEPRIGAKSV